MSRTKSQGAHSTMNNPNDYLVGLDIGSHKVLCVVALPSPKGEGLYRICGYSFRDSHSFRMLGSPSAAPRSRARTAWARPSCEAMR